MHGKSCAQHTSKETERAYIKNTLKRHTCIYVHIVTSSYTEESALQHYLMQSRPQLLYICPNYMQMYMCTYKYKSLSQHGWNIVKHTYVPNKHNVNVFLLIFTLAGWNLTVLAPLCHGPFPLRQPPIRQNRRWLLSLNSG